MTTLRVWVVSVIAFAFLTSGCGTSKQITDEVAFRRKMECEKYASKVESEYRAADRELGGKKGDALYSVDRISYSPKRNSCVCALRVTLVGSEYVTVFDVLTKEQLWSKTYFDNERQNATRDIAEHMQLLQ